MPAPRSAKVAAMLKAAGIDPLGTPPPSLPPGTPIVEFTVPMRPCPWKVPFVTRSGACIKDARLMAWQAEVKRRCVMAMGGRKPYAGPVRLEVAFHFAARAGREPDTTNAIKSTEDALQGSAIRDDRQVQRVGAERFLDGEDYAAVAVYAMAPQ